MCGTPLSVVLLLTLAACIVAQESNRPSQSPSVTPRPQKTDFEVFEFSSDLDYVPYLFDTFGTSFFQYFGFDSSNIVGVDDDDAPESTDDDEFIFGDDDDGADDEGNDDDDDAEFNDVGAASYLVFSLFVGAICVVSVF